jgi:hypothetical protein
MDINIIVSWLTESYFVPMYRSIRVHTWCVVSFPFRFLPGLRAGGLHRE